MALKALDETIKEFNGDPERLYLTGLSMGGYGTWSIGSKFPPKFAALAPICLEQSKHDPQIAEKLVQLKITSRYKRSDYVMSAGWATMPGATEAVRRVADACVDKLEL